MKFGEEYVVDDAAYVIPSVRVQFTFVAELISVFVFERGLDVGEGDRMYANIVKVM